MCGIVGIISSYSNGFSSKEAQALEELIYMDTLRGFDATGIMYADNKKNIQVHKAAMPGFAFLSTKEWKDSRSELIHKGRWAFAHNRAATRGAKTDENAHPFVVNDNIILMQNGTYKGDHKKHKDTEVDTEACAHVIAESTSISEALKKLNAAFTFVWYNVKESTIYAIHNEDRPLAIGYLKDGGVLLGSEKDMLALAGSRAGLEFKNPPYDVKEGQLLSFNMDGDKYKENHQDIEYKYSGAAWDGAEWGSYLGGNYHQRTLPAPQASNRHHFGRKSPLDLFRVIPEKFVEVYDESVIPHLRHRYNKLVTGHILIEGQDYQPMYDSPNCTEYYVWGILCWSNMTGEDEGDRDQGLVCVWKVDCKSETEMVNYSTNFFKARPDILMARYLSGTKQYHAMLEVTDVVECKSLAS
jgi:hypothetical protein